MKRSEALYKMTATALLIAIGIVIPMVFPKIPIEPMSFTLASHVAIFLGMFISPTVAIAVTIGTTVGFLFSGLSLIVVLRAASHIVFVIVGSLLLRKKPALIGSVWKSQIFSFGIGVIHAVCEMAVVSVFYFGNHLTAAFYAQGFVRAVLLLVGVGTLVHSMVDFALALGLEKLLCRNKALRPLFIGH